MNRRRRFLFFALILIFCSWYSRTSAQGMVGSVPSKISQLQIAEAKSPIVIDGMLDESDWMSAEVADNFWMSFPVDNERAPDSLRSEVRMTYDNNFIYIGVICYGNDEYIIQTLKRDKDFWDGDAFAIAIDPVNQKTNGFLFGVNPAGVQTEALLSGQSQRRGDGGSSSNYNVAWDNKWFSEVRVYPDKWIIEIAIPYKTLRFKDNSDVWGINFTRGDKKTNSFHVWAPVPMQFRSIDLGFLGRLKWDKAPKKPKNNISIIPYGLTRAERNFEEGTKGEQHLNAGVDAKVAISSSLNLDLTFNPDFSQVDVDEQVTNLTRFNVRFPERRLFFLENSDLFEDFGIPPMRPFFSRRIGLDNEGESIPILYGLRMSGNLNQDTRLGVMNLQTKETAEFLSQNYSSVAVHQRIFQKSIVKAYFHNRNEIGGASKDYNRVGGGQILLRSNDGKVNGFLGYGKSFTQNDDKENYFYNIGGGFDSRTISVYTNLAGVGDGYVNDMGWIPIQEHYDAEQDTTYHIGAHHWFSRFSYTLYRDNNPKIISHQFSGRNIIDVTAADLEKFTGETSVGYALRLGNTSRVEFGYNHINNRLLYPFAFTDGEPLPAGNYSYDFVELEYRSDERKAFVFRGGLLYGSFYNGTRAQYSLGFNYRAQPWGNFGINYIQNELEFPAPYASSTLRLLSPRVEINFSRKLFWTTFVQFNTQDDNFNINSRIQWRFKPMSDLFIVYTDNYAVEMFGPKSRSLVIKLNYWLNI